MRKLVGGKERRVGSRLIALALCAICLCGVSVPALAQEKDAALAVEATASEQSSGEIDGAGLAGVPVSADRTEKDIPWDSAGAPEATDVSAEFEAGGLGGYIDGCVDSSLEALPTEPEERITQKASGFGYFVTASYGASAGIPEDAALCVDALSGAAYETCLHTASAIIDEGEALSAAWFFRIYFVAEGVTVQPVDGSGVSVSITLTGKANHNGQMDVMRIKDGSVDLVHAGRSGNTVTFDTDGTSVYGVTVLQPVMEDNAPTVFYTVSFEIGAAATAAGVSAPAPLSVSENTSPKNLPTPVWYDADGNPEQSFAGWYMDEDLTIQFEEAMPVTANITLYAKWEDIITGVNLNEEGISPDDNFIVVSKHFVGITKEQIPSGFQIQVTKTSGGEGYTLNGENATKSADELTWQWRIEGVGAGSYMVEESGQEVSNYRVTTDGTGPVEVKAADFEVSYKRYTTCNHTNWPVGIQGDQNFLFAASLTGSNGCIVISKASLTTAQRATITKTIIGMPGSWKEPIKFYSIEENGNGPYFIEGRELHYSPETQEIILHATSDWSQVATLTYSITEASNPDIDIKNTYTPLTTSVEILKVVTGSMGDKTKRFNFTVTCTEVMGKGDGYTLSEDGKTAVFSLGHAETMTLYGVRLGSTLTIQEGNASGYEAVITVGETAIEGNSYTIPAVGPIRITVTNCKEGAPDTGVLLDSLPYLFILAVVVAGTFVFLSRHRHYDES